MSIKSLILHATTKVSKHMPTMLILGGIGVGVTAAVMAVRKTPKLYLEYVDYKEKLNKIEEMENDPTARFIVEQGETDDEPNLYAPYDSEVAQHDRNEVVRAMVGKTIRGYALPVGLGLVSITMILIGYKMKCKALIAMTAAYNTTLASFKTYRRRVADKYGKEVENDIYLGRETEIHEETDEEGNLKVSQAEKVNPIDGTIVLRFAEDTSSEYRADAMFIRNFLNLVERNAQTIYENRTVKHLYLTEITDALGMERDFDHSGKGWCEKLSDEEVYLKIDFAGNTNIVYEDGKPVAYIPVDIDGFIA